MYSAASIANAFLSRAFADKKSISPMKIQKLIYLAHGYYLAENDEPHVNEVFEAWRFGPVLNSLYHQCKYFDERGITKYLDDNDWDVGTLRTPAPVPQDEAAVELIAYIWQEFGDSSPMSLSRWTHEKGGPWDTVTKGGNQILLHQDVPNDLIKEYFKCQMYER